MILILQSFLIAVCFVDLILCVEEDDRHRLQKALFVDTEPHLEHFQVIKMLKDLRDIQANDLRETDELLKRSEVSKARCSAKPIFEMDGLSGRAKQLMVDSRKLQAELCEDLWRVSSQSAIIHLTEQEKSFADSIIGSMIEANSGQDFTGDWFDMPFENAQKGVLNYMEKKLGKTILKETSLEQFNKFYYELVYGPCGTIADKLDIVKDGYRNLIVYFNDLVRPQNQSTAYKWAKAGVVCSYLKGSGFSSNNKRKFRMDFYTNLRENKL